MTIAQKIIDQKTSKLELVQGKKDNGTPFWAYVLFPADVLEQLKPKFGKEKIQVNKYGIIIQEGIGRMPTAEMQKKVLNDFANLKKTK